MYYEINVSLNGKHLFATDKRSITTFEQLRHLYSIFKQKFPEANGYKLTVNRNLVTGEELSEKEVLG